MMWPRMVSRERSGSPSATAAGMRACQSMACSGSARPTTSWSAGCAAESEWLEDCVQEDAVDRLEQGVVKRRDRRRRISPHRCPGVLRCRDHRAGPVVSAAAKRGDKGMLFLHVAVGHGDRARPASAAPAPDGPALSFIGSPLMALPIAVPVSFYVLGVRRGWSSQHLVTVAESALKPVGMVLLVVGAGGVFGSVLVASGVGDVLSTRLTSTGLLLVCWRSSSPWRCALPRFGDRGHRRHLRHHRLPGRTGAPLCGAPGLDLHRDGRRRHLHLARQRRRILAGQPLLRYQRKRTP